MIKTVNLQKIFRTDEVETLALNSVSIEVQEGEFVAIMGPSGCGKSTLLNILGLLDNPTGGEYYLNGIEVSKYTESQRTRLRKGVIGFVFQSFNLIDELNVYENIELPLLYMGVPASERKKKVKEAMARMAISHREKHFPQQLSTTKASPTLLTTPRMSLMSYQGCTPGTANLSTGLTTKRTKGRLCSANTATQWATVPETLRTITAISI